MQVLGQNLLQTFKAVGQSPGKIISKSSRFAMGSIAKEKCRSQAAIYYPEQFEFDQIVNPKAALIKAVVVGISNSLNGASV